MTKQTSIRSCDGGVADGFGDGDGMPAMEVALSETTEAVACQSGGVFLEPLLAYGVPVNGSLAFAEEYGHEGPQEPEPGCCDMPMDEYDPGSMTVPEDENDRMRREIEELALAEPEPPEEE